MVEVYFYAKGKCRDEIQARKLLDRLTEDVTFGCEKVDQIEKISEVTEKQDGMDIVDRRTKTLTR